MCEICESMLAAEHSKQVGADLCPRCGRFPLNAELPLDVLESSQWQHVTPETPRSGDKVLLTIPTKPEAPLPELAEEEDLDELEDDETEEPIRTCYHCYQILSGLGERCPVCGDSFLPWSLRKHRPS